MAVMQKSGLVFRPRACTRCGGDAFLDRGDDNDWRCLQCGRTVAVAAISTEKVPVAAGRRAA